MVILMHRFLMASAVKSCQINVIPLSSRDGVTDHHKPLVIGISSLVCVMFDVRADKRRRSDIYSTSHEFTWWIR